MLYLGVKRELYTLYSVRLSAVMIKCSWVWFKHRECGHARVTWSYMAEGGKEVWSAKNTMVRF